MKTAAQDTQSSQRRECSREGMFNTVLYVFFVISRVTNHHDKGHSRKLQTVSYAFDMCPVAGAGDMGMEFRKILILIFSLNFFLGYLLRKQMCNVCSGQK